MPTTHGASLAKNANTTSRLSSRDDDLAPPVGSGLAGLSTLHSARSQLIGQRTQLMNGPRLSEFGSIAERGLLAELAAIVRDESDQRLPATARAEPPGS